MLTNIYFSVKCIQVRAIWGHYTQPAQNLADNKTLKKINKEPYTNYTV